MFDDDGVVILTEEEARAFDIAWLETPYGSDDFPDPVDFVRDPHQRYLDKRIRLLNTGAALLENAAAAGQRMARDEARRLRALAGFAQARPAAMFDRVPGETGAASAESIAARPG